MVLLQVSFQTSLITVTFEARILTAREWFVYCVRQDMPRPQIQKMDRLQHIWPLFPHLPPSY